ncbi:MAG: hypothetical protein K0U12_02025 [Gammaproteobacteria bacterium]|nr:hypothetical protein [Gammaproteobacteria bacterium]
MQHERQADIPSSRDAEGTCVEDKQSSSRQGATETPQTALVDIFQEGEGVQDYQTSVQVMNFIRTVGHAGVLGLTAAAGQSEGTNVGLLSGILLSNIAATTMTYGAVPGLEHYTLSTKRRKIKEDIKALKTFFEQELDRLTQEIQGINALTIDNAGPMTPLLDQYQAQQAACQTLLHDTQALDQDIDVETPDPHFPRFFGTMAASLIFIGICKSFNLGFEFAGSENPDATKKIDIGVAVGSVVIILSVFCFQYFKDAPKRKALQADLAKHRKKISNYLILGRKTSALGIIKLTEMMQREKRYQELGLSAIFNGYTALQKELKELCRGRDKLKIQIKAEEKEAQESQEILKTTKTKLKDKLTSFNEENKVNITLNLELLKQGEIKLTLSNKDNQDEEDKPEAREDEKDKLARIEDDLSDIFGLFKDQFQANKIAQENLQKRQSQLRVTEEVIIGKEHVLQACDTEIVAQQTRLDATLSPAVYESKAELLAEMTTPDIGELSPLTSASVAVQQSIFAAAGAAASSTQAEDQENKSSKKFT